MSENYIVINGKKAELTKEQLEKLGIKEKKDRRWRAEHKEKYWFVKLALDKYGYIIDSDTEMYALIDNKRYYAHNYFQTQEEAQKYANVLNTEMELMKYADENNDKIVGDWYYLYSYNTEKDYRIARATEFRIPRNIKFSSREIANNAVVAVGRDRVIEYLAYEW